MASYMEVNKDAKKEKVPVGPEKKRRERPVDEIDELFAQGSSKRGKVAPVDVVEPELELEEVDLGEEQEEKVLVVKKKKKSKDGADLSGMDAIMSALKGSVS